MKRLLFVVLLLGVFIGRVTPASAQSNIKIDITYNETTLEFPNYLTFNLSANSSGLIKKATLVYGTAGLSCQRDGTRQQMDIEHPKSVLHTSWDWDITGVLPLGTEVWWQWELETVGGGFMATERQTIKIEDDNNDWDSVNENGVTVHWYEGNNQFGDDMLALADESVERISADFGLDRPDNIQLWLYPDSEAVREALVYVPEWTGGIAYPEQGTTILGVGPGDEEWAEQIVPHELTHLIVGVRMFNCRAISLPTWLNEGLARYAENRTSADEDIIQAELESAFKAGRVPPLRSLEAGFSAYSNSASLSYTQSYKVVQYLIETYGPEKLDQLLTLMQQGETIDPALLAIYGFDTNGLDVAWRGSWGYSATPTAEADVLALQATPTVVPTLALSGIPMAQLTATPPPTAVPTSTPAETAPPSLTPTATSTPRPELIPAPPLPSPATPNLLYVGGAVLTVAVCTLALATYFSRRS